MKPPSLDPAWPPEVLALDRLSLRLPVAGKRLAHQLMVVGEAA